MEQVKQYQSAEGNGNQTQTIGTLKTIDEFRVAKNTELQVKQNNLVAEFKQRKGELVAKTEGFVAEYEIVGKMAYVNSGKYTPEVILAIEESISKKWKSISLLDWQSELGLNKFTLFICEILNYFFASFKTKERVDGVELMRLVAKIYAYDKHLKISELIEILGNATKGHYGSSFNRVDEETFFGWVKQYNERKSLLNEVEKVNSKTEQPNIPRVSDPQQEFLSNYEATQRAMKEIRDKVNEQK